MILYSEVFEIVPVAQERPRVRVIVPKDKGAKPFATVYDPKKSKDFKIGLGNMAEAATPGWVLIDEAMVMSCKVYIARPKSVKREFPEVKPDLSNYLKGIEDAMNKIVYTDDSKIVSYTDCWKLYTLNVPRIEVTLFTVR